MASEVHRRRITDSPSAKIIADEVLDCADRILGNHVYPTSAALRDVGPLLFRRTLSAWDCSRFALWPGEFCHARNVSVQVLVPAAMFSAALRGCARPPGRRTTRRRCGDDQMQWQAIDRLCEFGGLGWGRICVFGCVSCRPGFDHSGCFTDAAPRWWWNVLAISRGL